MTKFTGTASELLLIPTRPNLRYRYLLPLALRVRKNRESASRLKYHMGTRIEIKRREWEDRVRTVTYDPTGYYIKTFNYFSQDQWDRITHLVPRAYPGRLVKSWYTRDRMEFVYSEIPGEVITEYTPEVLEFMRRDLDRTWPIAHGDWHLSNVIRSGQELHMIDYDRISTKYRTKQQALKHMLEHVDDAIGHTGIHQSHTR